MKWFKFYGQDYLSDPKMLSMSPAERSCWLTLLCYGSVNDDGVVQYINEQQLMLQSGLDFSREEWDKTVGVLKKLQLYGMITLKDEVITINNWKKRQETSLTSYERVKRYRQKKQNDNTMITLEENRIEKNRIDIPNTDAFETFWKYYPKKELKKKAQTIWLRKNLDPHLSEILEFIKLASESDRWKSGYIKQPTTFLNGECWNDDIQSYNDKNPNVTKSLILK